MDSPLSSCHLLCYIADASEVTQPATDVCCADVITTLEEPCTCITQLTGGVSQALILAVANGDATLQYLSPPGPERSQCYMLLSLCA